MKKLFGCFLCLMLLVLFAAPAMAVPTYPADEFLGSTILFAPNKSDLDEQAWLEGLTGVGPQVWIDTIDFADGPKVLEDYDPGFGWIYAVVKIGEGGHTQDWLFAYRDNPDGVSLPGLDNILTAPGPGSEGNPYIRGVSHIQFFGPQDVPEPATMFLLGTGFVVLAGFGRKRIL